MRALTHFNTRGNGGQC